MSVTSLARPAAPAGLPSQPIPLKYGDSPDFHRALRQRVDGYFDAGVRGRRDAPQMYVKTALVLAWCIGSYALLMAFAPTWWLAWPLAVSLGLSMAAVAFNVQHDGSHQAYSRRRSVNSLMAFSLDLLGGSSYLWARKHNTIHHSYTNVTGHDDDIDIGPLGRLSPHQKRHWFHRFQHLYLWFLYGLLPVKWQFYDDFRDVLTGRNAGMPFARPKGWDLVIFITGKALFAALALAIPLMLHSPWLVLPLLLAASYVQGTVLSIVFQLAHCVEEATFPLPESGTGRMKSGWAEHQIETTINFARGSRVLSWLVGGLNFQIEHHLFPRICHIHYPALAPLVEETCREFGVRYASHETLADGIASHYRWLRRMGMANAV